MKTRHDIRRPVDRRSFLKFSLMSLTAAGFGTMPGFLRRARAAVNPGKKFLFIFLRGGQDAIQTVIPYMDGELAAARPLRGIGVNPADAHPLDGGPAALYPVFQEATLPNSSNPGAKLSDIYHGGGVEGFAGGDFAVVHRVGYENQNRSHFSSQQFYENGVPGNVQLEKGVFNNYITANPGAGVLRGATLDRNQMVMMKGDTLIPVIRSIGDFRLPSNVPIGTYPPPGSGLKGGYGQRGFDASIPYTTRTYGTGRALLDSVEFFEANLSGDYTPTSSLPGRIENGAERYYNGIDNGRFRGFIKDCARLLKTVPELQIVGCNQGGYDTHGSENRRFNALSRDLGLALTALRLDLASIWQDMVILTMTEFGRTSRQNNNLGTDHGEAACNLLLGGSVRGGVYNCHDGGGLGSTWRTGDIYESRGRYVKHRTDYRQLYSEILEGHLGLADGVTMDEIIPGFSSLSGPDFRPLNLIS